MDVSTFKAFKEKKLAAAAEQSPVLYKPFDSLIPKSEISAFAGPQSSLLHDSNGISTNLNVGVNNETPWYRDGGALQGYAGLASSFAQLASLPGQLKLAKLQRQGLQQNIDQAKTDSAFRAATRENLNKPVANTGGI